MPFRLLAYPAAYLQALTPRPRLPRCCYKTLTMILNALVKKMSAMQRYTLTWRARAAIVKASTQNRNRVSFPSQPFLPVKMQITEWMRSRSYILPLKRKKATTSVPRYYTIKSLNRWYSIVKNSVIIDCDSSGLCSLDTQFMNSDP